MQNAKTKLIEFKGPGKYAWVVFEGRKKRYLTGKPLFLPYSVFDSVSPTDYIEYDPSGCPGTALSEVLATAGITPYGNCPCKEFASLMDLYGNEWVHANRHTVVSWLQRSTAAPRALLEELILQAVKRSEGKCEHDLHTKR